MLLFPCTHDMEESGTKEFKEGNCTKIIKIKNKIDFLQWIYIKKEEKEERFPLLHFNVSFLLFIFQFHTLRVNSWIFLLNNKLKCIEAFFVPMYAEAQNRVAIALRMQSSSLIAGQT